MAPTTRLLALALALCGATATSVSAQNVEGDSRLRFGVFLQGYSLPARETVPGGVTGDVGGYGVGASFGYDWSLWNGWIVGLEADGVAIDAGTNIRGSKYNGDYLANVRGRLGYNLDRNWLVYATGGLAVNGIHYRGSTTSTVGNPNAILKESATLPGWTIGTGAEWRYYGSILFGEYLYANYQPFEFTGGFNINRQLDTESHTFRLGVKWLIGHDYYDDVKYPRR